MLMYGAGGHAKVVQRILHACELPVRGVFDDDPGSRDLDARPYASLFLPGELLIIAIGNNHDRRRVAGTVTHAFGLAIHPTALIDPSVVPGEGSVIVHRAVVQAGSCVGSHLIINTGAVVEHDCVLADFVHVGPCAVLCGSVQIGECTLVGAGSVILPGIRIGAECVIGAGSVVTRNVPDGAKVAGNLARCIS